MGFPCLQWLPVCASRKTVVEDVVVMVMEALAAAQARFTGQGCVDIDSGCSYFSARLEDCKLYYLCLCVKKSFLQDKFSKKVQ